jgi:asparagine synthase (glutamine-hydrolysing)
MLARDPFASEEAMLESYAELDRRWRRLDRSDPINGRLTTDREVFLPGDLLPKVDRMSMAHSLEVRVPFLDNEVVDLVLPLAGRHKASLFRNKILLRRAVEGLIPRTTATRRKQAFAVPIDAWLRGSLREVATDLLSEKSVEHRGLFASEAVQGLLRDHLENRRDCGLQLWTLMVLEHWQRGLDDYTLSETT